MATRLDAVARHLGPSAPPKLLTDAQVASFLVQGYLVLRAEDQPPSFHEALHAESIRHAGESRDLPFHGNHCLSHTPRLAQVFQSPMIGGALTSLLGRDFAINNHRWGANRPRGGCTILRLDHY
jgi:hypothetical protein